MKKTETEDRRSEDEKDEGKPCPEEDQFVSFLSHSCSEGKFPDLKKKKGRTDQKEARKKESGVVMSCCRPRELRNIVPELGERSRCEVTGFRKMGAPDARGGRLVKGLHAEEAYQKSADRSQTRKKNHPALSNPS